VRRESFETARPPTLDLSLRSGSIEIETTGGTTTEVELSAGGDSEEARRLLDDARIELRGDDEIVVSVPKPGFFGFLRDLDLRLSIRTPDGAVIEAETATADVRGRGRFGSLEARSASGGVEVETVVGDAVVKTASGDVEVADVGGAAVVNTASGDVRLGRVVGETVVKSASGDVRVREAGSGVNVSTASGDQRIGSVAVGSVALQSASGDIEVGIAKGSNVWVDARAMSGSTTSELELGEAEPVADDAPLVELRATTMSGDVSVLRAAAATGSAI
jgi:DUF4097 and DUF4098 domain-containing protein YvlB